MKVLFHHHTPFALAAQPWRDRILPLAEALKSTGVELEFLRWYDGKQSGDILHFFGRLPTYLISFARQKGMRIVITDTPGRGREISAPDLFALGLGVRLLENLLPGPVVSPLDWDSYGQADVCIVTKPAEAEWLKRVFRVDESKIKVLADSLPPAETAAKLKALYEGLAKTSR